MGLQENNLIIFFLGKLLENIGLCDIIDSFAEGVVVHAPDAKIVNYNPKSLEILKVTKDQLLGVTPMHPQWETILPDGSPFPIEKNPALVTIKTGQPVLNEVMGIVTGKKQVSWLKISSQPVKGKDGVYAVVTFSDITDIHIQNLQNEMVLESSGVGIWKYDIQGNIIQWDDSMYRLYGINRDDFSGDYNAWESSLHPDDKERGNKEIELAIKGIKDFDTTFRIITPKKEIRFIRAKAKIIKDMDGKPHLMIGTNWDVTEEEKNQQVLREAKESAEKYANAKSSFLANMSHEIRTPMNGILGMADMLKSTNLTEEQREMIDIIFGSGNSLLEIINDILDISAIETGNLKFQEDDFDLYKKLNDTIALFRAFASQKEIEINLSIEDSVPQFVHSDATRIGQVISNFLGNAIKFSSKGSKIEVDVAYNSVDGAFVFDVKDHGIGMSETELENVFEEFFQVDSGSNRMYEGSGLGLSISKKIANLLGGEIYAKSKKGVGTTFSFKVCLKSSLGSGKNIEETEYKGKLSVEYPYEILVAEDNKVNQKVITKILSKHGYEIELADDGLIAVEMFKKKKYSLVLMDLQMPNMDGYQATEEILKISPDTMVVAITANVLPEQEKRCYQVGMKGFIGKPFTSSKIAEMIRNL